MTGEPLTSNTRMLSHFPNEGHGDALQLCGERRGGRYYLYVGHMWSGGVSVLDATDPTDVRPVHFIASATPATWHINLQVADDLLMLANERILPGWSSIGVDVPHKAGVSFFDVSDPASPRHISDWHTTGGGTHRNWYAGGRYAYLTASEEGYAGRFLIVLDLADITRPVEAGRWWVAGQAVKLGEEPAWPTERGRGHYTLHGGIVHGDTAYLAYEDFGIYLVDVADPSRPHLIGQYRNHPPFGGYAHTALPLPDRDLLVLAEETIKYNCLEEQKRIWLLDIREPENPVSVATLPMPVEPPGEPGWCEKGGRFGPHNLHENRPGAWHSDTVIFNAFFNAGLRVWDIRDQYQPREIAWFLPPAPVRIYDERPGAARAISSQDVYVDDRGVCFVTDYNAGIYAVELMGEARDALLGSSR